MTALLRRALLSCVVAGAVDVATLRGSTIAMVGDSTMRTQFERLCGLLNASAARTPAKPLVFACAGRNVTVAWMSPKDRGDFGFHKGLEALGHCLASTFTRDGVARLNARLLATLGGLDADVGVVDGFGLTDGRCDETKDGRHYPARELAEIAALVALLAPDAAKRRGEG
ncbi:hypothetical protein JL720_15506 [Aureococcus anophagefferens]|nr:hypothetical protein JL720_15506 [Aureococcus anophagefferens]